MRKYVSLLVLLFAALACSLPRALPPTFAATPVPGGETPATVPPIEGQTGSGTLGLVILSPLNGAVVNTSSVEIRGQAPVGAVISINDDVLIIGADGTFKHSVSLQEGPNVIEILASDAQGNESHLFLSIFYEP